MSFVYLSALACKELGLQNSCHKSRTEIQFAFCQISSLMSSIIGIQAEYVERISVKALAYAKAAPA